MDVLGAKSFGCWTQPNPTCEKVLNSIYAVARLRMGDGIIGSVKTIQNVDHDLQTEWCHDVMEKN
jgi:hypothetical protein